MESAARGSGITNDAQSGRIKSTEEHAVRHGELEPSREVGGTVQYLDGDEVEPESIVPPLTEIAFELDVKLTARHQSTPTRSLAKGHSRGIFWVVAGLIGGLAAVFMRASELTTAVEAFYRDFGPLGFLILLLTLVAAVIGARRG
jgi:hypothetical protein